MSQETPLLMQFSSNKAGSIPVEPTVGGKDATVEPQGWVHGVLAQGNNPALLPTEWNGIALWMCNTIRQPHSKVGDGGTASVFSTRSGRELEGALSVGLDAGRELGIAYQAVAIGGDHGMKPLLPGRTLHLLGEAALQHLQHGLDADGGAR